MKATEILNAAGKHLADRGATYDKPEGERSMQKTITAFNAIADQSLTVEQGWLFMTLLKAVRTQQGCYKPDNYEDGAAYFALAGEQASIDRT
jgi:hypothetical protein